MKCEKYKRCLTLLLALTIIITSIAAFGTKVFADETAPKSLLILGDSISTGYGLDNPDADSYGAKLAAALKISGQGYNNCAVDGLTSEGLIAALLDSSMEILLEECDIIVISIGGNDVMGPFFDIAKEALELEFAASNEELQSAVAVNPDAITKVSAALLNNQEKFADLSAAFIENLDQIVDCIKTANPNAELYIHTIYNPFGGVPGFEMLSLGTDVVIKPMNSAITKNAGSNGYKVADINKAFKEKGPEYTNITSLDIHPNAAGHELIFNILRDIIGQPEKEQFDDVQKSDWYYESVNYVYAGGLMLGTSAEPLLFSPEMNLTRAMFVTILYRIANSPDVNKLENLFDDVDEDKYYTNAVKWAAANSIVFGYGNNKFGPDDKIRRKDLAVVLSRYSGMLEVEIKDTDILDHLTETFAESGAEDLSAINEATSDATRAEAAVMLHMVIVILQT